MDISLLRRLIHDDDPLQTLYEALTSSIWTAERFAAARQDGNLAAYLRDGEHAASILEREVYAVYSDLYTLLEGSDPRRNRAAELRQQEQYTLLLVDALSLREIPLLQETFAAHGLELEASMAIAPVPTETIDFARGIGGTGPSDIAANAARFPFAFRHIAREDWQPDFRPSDRQRFIWYAFPDDYFDLKETDYARHVVQPVTAMLETVLNDPSLVHPLVVTSDHGYIWQGGACAWALPPDEATVLARYFKGGRSTREADEGLAATGKAWVYGNVGAARGRFAWGGMVRGAGSLFKHGGVSLLECMVPWVMAQV